jgi:putative spermidine/putrescine transport system ATP-binding protein
VHQAAPPADVYRRPADAFVAGFIGATNLLPVADGRVLGHPVPGLAGSGTLSIRPEDLVLGPPASGLPGRIAFLRDLGGALEAFVEAGGATLTAALPARDRGRHAVGEEVGLSWSGENARLLPP